MASMCCRRIQLTSPSTVTQSSGFFCLCRGGGGLPQRLSTCAGWGAGRWVGGSQEGKTLTPKGARHMKYHITSSTNQCTSKRLRRQSNAVALTVPRHGCAHTVPPQSPMAASTNRGTQGVNQRHVTWRGSTSFIADQSPGVPFFQWLSSIKWVVPTCLAYFFRTSSHCPSLRAISASCSSQSASSDPEIHVPSESGIECARGQGERGTMGALCPGMY